MHDCCRRLRMFRILKIFSQYVAIRLAITLRVPSPSEMSTAITRSIQIQDALWLQAKLVAAGAHWSL